MKQGKFICIKCSENNVKFTIEEMQEWILCKCGAWKKLEKVVK